MKIQFLLGPKYTISPSTHIFQSRSGSGAHLLGNTEAMPLCLSDVQEDPSAPLLANDTLATQLHLRQSMNCH